MPAVTPIQTGQSMGVTGGGDITINLSTLVPTAQTGEVIINSIRAYNRAAGPANIAVA
jgi:hypothetical protein